MYILKSSLVFTACLVAAQFPGGEILVEYEPAGQINLRPIYYMPSDAFESDTTVKNSVVIESLEVLSTATATVADMLPDV